MWGENRRRWEARRHGAQTTGHRGYRSVAPLCLHACLPPSLLLPQGTRLPLERVQGVEAAVDEDDALGDVGERVEGVDRGGARLGCSRAEGEGRGRAGRGTRRSHGGTHAPRRPPQLGSASGAAAAGTQGRQAGGAAHAARRARDVVQGVVRDDDGADEERQDAAHAQYVARQVGQVGRHADERHLLRSPVRRARSGEAGMEAGACAAQRQPPAAASRCPAQRSILLLLSAATASSPARAWETWWKAKARRQ